MHWLERNVHVVLDRVEADDPVIKDYAAKRSVRYQGRLPRNICRHIILSDVKGVSALMDVSTLLYSVAYRDGGGVQR